LYKEVALVTLESLTSGKSRIALVGLGYVGLPLAVAFDGIAEVIGYDISARKIEELKRCYDATGEITSSDLASTKIEFTADPGRLKEAAFIIVTVPTPVHKSKRPDLGPVKSASRTIGQNLAQNSIVVFESTFYPGVTEEICIPILEAESGLTCGVDFKVGYSPERINPGDQIYTVKNIVKVVSGQDTETLETIASVYEAVITAGVFRASSIRVAEAAKVIENTQRDLNIALMNELSILFDKMGISTRDVLEAAGTKWNFLKFKPGLVGGHCIGVDPYYLTHKAEVVGYNPQVILAGRRINDGMGKYVAEMTVKKLIEVRKAVNGCRVLVLGLTFKENVPDIRNSKVVDILKNLNEFGVTPLVHDPLVNANDVFEEYGLEMSSLEEVGKVDGVVWAVDHDAFKHITPLHLKELCGNGNGHGVIVDVKSKLNRAEVESQGLVYWSL
jgi:UDP-N-acetyl-D-galactosamine dehydrogenase